MKVIRQSRLAGDQDGGMAFVPHLVRESQGPSGELNRVGHPLLDAYLELITARAHPNTVLAQAYDLKVFFLVLQKDPAEVTHADVLESIKAQRQPRLGDKVVRIEDGEAGLSARTIKRRLATITSLYDYLIVRGGHRCGAQPGAARARRAPARPKVDTGRAVDPGTAHAAARYRPERDRRAHG